MLTLKQQVSVNRDVQSGYRSSRCLEEKVANLQICLPLPFVIRTYAADLLQAHFFVALSEDIALFGDKQYVLQGLP